MSFHSDVAICIPDCYIHLLTLLAYTKCWVFITTLIITLPTGGVQSIGIVCLSVFVSVCVCLHTSKITCPNFAKFSVHTICGRGSVLLWWQHDPLCTSSFVHGIMFSLFWPELVKHVSYTFATGQRLSVTVSDCYPKVMNPRDPDHCQSKNWASSNLRIWGLKNWHRIT